MNDFLKLFENNDHSVLVLKNKSEIRKFRKFLRSFGLRVQSTKSKMFQKSLVFAGIGPRGYYHRIETTTNGSI